MGSHVVVSRKHGSFLVMVDDQDDALLLSVKWGIHVRGDGSIKQVKTGRRNTSGGTETRSLHRMLLDPGPGMVVDHKNGNPLDNRRGNLRACTQRQNTRNQKIKSRKANDLPAGVTVDRRGRFMARISDDSGNRLYLGTFGTAEEASAARSGAECAIYGEFSPRLRLAN